jgi:hypothetical protein
MRTTVFDLPKPLWIVEDRPPYGDEIKLASLQTMSNASSDFVRVGSP